MKPTHIVIHHSFTEDSATLSWGIIRRNHIQKGFEDVGYHFGIEFVRSSYEILLGRFVGEEGAHCPQGGMNRKSIGICLVGNFDDIPPSVAQLKILRRLVRFLCNLYDIPHENVHGHRDFNPHKTCPGKAFDLESFRASL